VVNALSPQRLTEVNTEKRKAVKYTHLGDHMSKLGKYCRAYPLSQLRQFPGWVEIAEAARRIRKEIDGEIVEEVRTLTDEDYVYLQMDYTVTDGIFVDENVIFSNVTPEWIEFCDKVLRKA
jgi:hypothetical protein